MIFSSKRVGLSHLVVILTTLAHLSACKTRTYEGTNTARSLSMQANSKGELSFSITLESSNQTQSYTLQSDSAYASGSPLEFLRVDQFATIGTLAMNVMDIHQDGSLYNVSNKLLAESPCYQVGLYSLAMLSGEIRILLTSALNSSPTLGLNESQKLGDFKYCQTARSVNLFFPDKTLATQFSNYLSQRGLSFNALELSETVGTSFISNSVGLWKRLSLNKSGVLKLSPNRPTKAAIESTQSKSFAKRISSNEEELKLYQALVPKLKAQETPPQLSQAQSSLSIVTIGDGKTYIRKIEYRDPRIESLSAFKARALRERANYFAQNEFAKQHPEGTFAKTYLSCVDDEMFVTLVDYQKGESLSRGLNRTGFKQSREDLVKFVAKAQEQLKIYQKGIPITLDGKSYTMSYFHGDLNPDNLVSNESGGVGLVGSSFTGRVVLRDENDKYFQLKTGPSGEPVIADLTISRPGTESIVVSGKNRARVESSAKLGSGYDETFALKGTPHFMSPETTMDLYGEHTGVSNIQMGAEAKMVLDNIDIYAMNCLTMLAATGKRPKHFEDLPEDTAVDDMVLWTFQNAKLRIADTRRLLTIEDFPPRSPEETEAEWESRINNTLLMAERDPINLMHAGRSKILIAR